MSFDRVVIFEDDKAKDFFPFSLNHALFELRNGIYSILEVVQNSFEGKLSFYLPDDRNYLSSLIVERHNIYPYKVDSNESVLFINARVVKSKIKELEESINRLNDREYGVAYSNGDVVFAVCSGDMAFKWGEIKKQYKLGGRFLYGYLWDVLADHRSAMPYDIKIWKEENKDYYEYNGLLTNDKDIYKVVKSGSVKINGNVVIEKGATISDFVYVEGDTFIAEGSVIKPFSHIKSSSINRVCKVSGEISGSVFMPYSNKQHYGFIGDSYVGEWVNLGAGTTNSNLKNTYGSVKVNIENRVVDSGKQFLGCMIGDYTRTAIGTLINTGSIIGLACNVFMDKLTPKYIPSFSWGLDGRYDIDKLIDTIRIMKSRRQFELTDTEEGVIRFLYKYGEKS